MPDANVQPVGRITLEGFVRGRGATADGVAI